MPQCQGHTSARGILASKGIDGSRKPERVFSFSPIDRALAELAELASWLTGWLKVETTEQQQQQRSRRNPFQERREISCKTPPQGMHENQETNSMGTTPSKPVRKAGSSSKHEASDLHASTVEERARGGVCLPCLHSLSCDYSGGMHVRVLLAVPVYYRTVR